MKPFVPGSTSTLVKDETIAASPREDQVSTVPSGQFPVARDQGPGAQPSSRETHHPIPKTENRKPKTEPFDPDRLSPRERRRRLKRAARDDLAAFVRELSNAALLDYTEGLWWSFDDPEWMPSDRALFQLWRSEQMEIAQQELERRRRMTAGGRALPAPFRTHSTNLERLCRAIHEQVHLADVLEDHGQPVARQRNESHSECPQCGGTDRFVIWPPPRSRGWCRQCGWNPDVIGFWRWFEGSTFADAVLAIAKRYLGIAVEVER